MTPSMTGFERIIAGMVRSLLSEGSVSSMRMSSLPEVGHCKAYDWGFWIRVLELHSILGPLSGMMIVSRTGLRAQALNPKP